MKNLNLAYCFSTTPQKELPQMLWMPLHLAHLFNNACQILDERATGKSKSKREFRVILVDRNVGKKGGKTTEGKKVSFGIERSLTCGLNPVALEAEEKEQNMTRY